MTLQSAIQRIIARGEIHSRDRVLLIGLHNDKACAPIATCVTAGTVVAIDPSRDAIFDARANFAHFENLMFLWAGAEEIPWQENFFTTVIARAAALREPERALAEIHRVMGAAAKLWIAVEEPAAAASAPLEPPRDSAARDARTSDSGVSLSRFSIEEALPRYGFVNIEVAELEGGVLLSARTPEAAQPATGDGSG